MPSVSFASATARPIGSEGSSESSRLDAPHLLRHRHRPRRRRRPRPRRLGGRVCLGRRERGHRRRLDAAVALLEGEDVAVELVEPCLPPRRPLVVAEVAVHARAEHHPDRPPPPRRLARRRLEDDGDELVDALRPLGVLKLALAVVVGSGAAAGAVDVRLGDEDGDDLRVVDPGAHLVDDVALEALAVEPRREPALPEVGVDRGDALLRVAAGAVDAAVVGEVDVALERRVRRRERDDRRRRRVLVGLLGDRAEAAAAGRPRRRGAGRARAPRCRGRCGARAPRPIASQRYSRSTTSRGSARAPTRGIAPAPTPGPDPSPRASPRTSTARGTRASARVGLLLVARARVRHLALAQPTYVPSLSLWRSSGVAPRSTTRGITNSMQRTPRRRASCGRRPPPTSPGSPRAPPRRPSFRHEDLAAAMW